MGLPMAKLDGTQELPNVVPDSSTVAFPRRSYTIIHRRKFGQALPYFGTIL